MTLRRAEVPPPPSSKIIASRSSRVMPYPQIGRRAALPQGSPLPISVITVSAYLVPGYTSKSVNLSR